MFFLKRVKDRFFGRTILARDSLSVGSMVDAVIAMSRGTVPKAAAFLFRVVFKNMATHLMYNSLPLSVLLIDWSCLQKHGNAWY